MRRLPLRLSLLPSLLLLALLTAALPAPIPAAAEDRAAEPTAATATMTQSVVFIAEPADFTITGFGASVTVSIKWDGTLVVGQITVNASGSATGSFTVPPSTQGAHTVVFAAPGGRTASAPVTLAYGIGDIVLDANGGPVGANLAWRIYAANQNETISIRIDDTEYDTGNSGASHFAEGLFQIPAISLGQHTLTAVGAIAGLYDTRTVYVTSASASLTLPVDRAPAGIQLELKLNGFTPNIGAVCSVSVGSIGSFKVPLDGAGSGETTFTVPNVSSQLAYVSCGDGSQFAATSFVISVLGASLSHNRGPAKSSISYAITGFPGLTEITVTFRGAVVAQAQTDSEGAASSTFQVPAEAATGAATVRFSYGAIQTSLPFTVTKATAALAFPSAQPGYTMSFTLGGFLPGAKTSILWNGNPLKSVTVSSQGALSGSFTIPSGALEKTHTVTFSGGGVSLARALRVIKPTATLSTNRAQPGATVSFSISKFPANTRVAILFGGIEIGSVRTGANGNAIGSFTVPSTTAAEVDTANLTRAVVWKTGRWSVRKTFTVTTTSLLATNPTAETGAWHRLLSSSA